jgi:hypothetical protein
VWVVFSSGRYIPLNVFEHSGVESLEPQLTSEVLGPANNEWTLIFDNRELKRNQPLSWFGIKNDSVIDLVYRGELVKVYPISVIIVVICRRLRSGLNPKETLEEFFVLFHMDGNADVVGFFHLQENLSLITSHLISVALLPDLC